VSLLAEATRVSNHNLPRMCGGGNSSERICLKHFVFVPGLLKDCELSLRFSADGVSGCSVFHRSALPKNPDSHNFGAVFCVKPLFYRFWRRNMRKKSAGFPPGAPYTHCLLPCFLCTLFRFAF